MDSKQALLGGWNVKPHSTHQKVITDEDVGREQREQIVDSIQSQLNVSNVEIEQAEDDKLELVLPDTIPTNKKPNVEDVIEEHLPCSIAPNEEVILHIRVDWPDAKYDICIDYE